MMLSMVLSRTKLLCALLCFYISLASAETPAPASATDSQIRTLLSLNGSEDSASQLARVIGDSVTAELHRTMPNLPARADGVISNTVETYLREQSSHGEMIERLVPIYAKYLTKSDVDQLIAFYKSPLGKKLASVTPGIAFDSGRAGQQWAASIAPGLQKRLQEVLQREKLIQ